MKILRQPLTLVLIGVLVAGISHAMTQIYGLAEAHWQRPNLFGDSFTFALRNNADLFGWLTSQHNEHRIVWAKAITVFETDILNIPIGQSALFQSMSLILASAGLWSWLCSRLLKRSDLRLLTALSGWLLLVNPWQYENLEWEFQTPWFQINVLVLLCSILLSFPYSRVLYRNNWTLLRTGLIILVPWVSLTTSGQGLAVVIAFCICTLLHNKQQGALLSFSTLLACITFYFLLPYNKPGHHPELSFSLDYFLQATMGGEWKGLGIFLIVIIGILLWRRQRIKLEELPPLLMPGLFSLLFTLMITLSRAGFGTEQASTSRYVTHSIMLGLSALLSLALIDDKSNRRVTPLIGSLLVLTTTLGSFPQAITGKGPTYSKAWEHAVERAESHSKGFECHLLRNSLESANILLLNSCSWVYPDEKFVNSYFNGQLPVQPLGWHKRFRQETTLSNQNNLLYLVDDMILDKSSIKLKGWAFLSNKVDEQLYIMANYGEDKKSAFLVDKTRHDVAKSKNLAHSKVGFEVEFPRTFEKKPLKTVLVGTPANAVEIWRLNSDD